MRATIKLGELSRKLPTTQGKRADKELVPTDGQKSKAEQLDEAGINTSVAQRASGGRMHRRIRFDLTVPTLPCVEEVDLTVPALRRVDEVDVYVPPRRLTASERWPVPHQRRRRHTGEVSLPSGGKAKSRYPRRRWDQHQQVLRD